MNSVAEEIKKTTQTENITSFGCFSTRPEVTDTDYQQISHRFRTRCFRKTNKKSSYLPSKNSRAAAALTHTKKKPQKEEKLLWPELLV